MQCHAVDCEQDRLVVARFSGCEPPVHLDKFCRHDSSKRKAVNATASAGNIAFDAQQCYGDQETSPNIAVALVTTDGVTLIPATMLDLIARPVTVREADSRFAHQQSSAQTSQIDTSAAEREKRPMEQPRSRTSALNELGTAFGTHKRRREIERLEAGRQTSAAGMFSLDDGATAADDIDAALDDAASGAGDASDTGATVDSGMRSIARSVQQILSKNVVKSTTASPTMSPGSQAGNSEAAALLQSQIRPPANAEADHPADVYVIADIVISTSALEAAKGAASRIAGSESAKTFAAVPRENAAYLTSRLSRLLATDDKESREKLALLFVVYAMQAIFRSYRFIGNRSKLTMRLDDQIPDALIDDIIARFSVQRLLVNSQDDNVESHAMTSQMQDKLLCYMFVLCLHIDDFSTDPMMLSADLGMRATRTISLFKSLGCSILQCSEVQRISLGLSKADAKNYKRADLKLPLNFPKISRGRNRK